MRILDFGFRIADCGLGGGVGLARAPRAAGNPPLAVSRGSRHGSRGPRLPGPPALALAFVTFLAPGCIADGKSRPPQERVTYVAKEQATPAYFMSQSPAAAATAADFDRLWQAIYRQTRNAGFTPDRQDYRLGVFTTRPLVSAQLFEPMRRDTGSFYGRLESTLATVRRTVRWDVTRGDDGTLTAVPKVLVERWSALEHRVTYSSQYQEIFALTREEQENLRLRALDPAAFAEEPVAATYWYPIARDTDLERRLAAGVQDRAK